MIYAEPFRYDADAEAVLFESYRSGVANTVRSQIDLMDLKMIKLSA